MRYLAATGVGILTAIAATIVWIALRFVLPITVPFMMPRNSMNQSGSGGAGAVIGSGSISLAALLGFIGGVVWTLSRR